MDCQICHLMPPKTPVATSCGHMFCWPCLCLVLPDPLPKPCPVCRATLRTTTNVIPVYGSKVNFDSRDAKFDSNGNGIVKDLEVLPRSPIPPSIAALELGASENYPTGIVVMKSLDVIEMVTEKLRSVQSELLSSFGASFDALYRELAEMHIVFVRERMSLEERHVDENMKNDLLMRIFAFHEDEMKMKQHWEESMEMAHDIAKMRNMVTINSNE